MNVTTDVTDFLNKFNLQKLDQPGFHPMLKQRVEHLLEEASELQVAIDESNKEELIDALLDVVYIAIGTAVLCGFDVEAHWNEIQRANMSKERGITKRGHAFDVCKPANWVGPDHTTILRK